MGKSREALLVFVFSFVIIHANSESVELHPPTAVAYLINNEYENTNFFTKEGKQGLDQNKILLNDIVNTDIEVDPGRSVQLECKGNEPIQWNYRGPGKPEFATTVEVDEENNEEIYKASLFIPSANEKDTGLYACSYAEFPKVYSSYHLFVPGPEIFVPHAGKAITYKTGTDYVIIPCPVTVKSARVTLRKVFFDDSLRNIEPPLATFDPKYGFKVSIKDFRDAEGTYVCTGYFKGYLRLLEFSLRSEEHNETAAVKFPDNEDLNPCLSYSCPSRSICRVNPNTHLPFCACRPKSGFSAQTNCTRLCKSSHDCPKSEKCQFSLEKQLKMCVHACDDQKCGENAECYVDEQRGIPKCRCRRGYQGNPGFLCERIPIKQDVPGNSYCSTTKCGPNAKCQNVDGRLQCVCFGSVGVWPNCERVCTSDIDCDRQDKCDDRHGVCVPVCSEAICAPKADCKVIRRQPMCLCPPGYTGKATEACYPSHFYYSGTSSRSGFSLEDIDVLENDPTTEATTTISDDSQITFENDSKRESVPFNLGMPSQSSKVEES